MYVQVREQHALPQKDYSHVRIPNILALIVYTSVYDLYYPVQKLYTLAQRRFVSMLVLYIPVHWLAKWTTYCTFRILPERSCFIAVHFCCQLFVCHRYSHVSIRLQYLVSRWLFGGFSYYAFSSKRVLLSLRKSRNKIWATRNLMQEHWWDIFSGSKAEGKLKT